MKAERDSDLSDRVEALTEELAFCHECKDALSERVERLETLVLAPAEAPLAPAQPWPYIQARLDQSAAALAELRRT